MTASAIRPARPAPGPPRDYRFPSFEKRPLPNGMQLLVATVAKLPLVTVTAIVDAGAVCDGDGLDGLARLVAKLLLEGTESNDGAQLIDRFERLGASVDAAADWDSAAVTMTALTENLSAAFEIFG